MLHVSLFDQFGALNSPPVFAALEQGLTKLGIKVSHHDMSADIAVIWSVVWQGRMKHNQSVWQTFANTGRPVMIAEVGTLYRGQTWKLALNGTGADAYYGDHFVPGRAATLGLRLKPWQTTGQDIVIVTQRGDSEQWHGQPTVNTWLKNTVDRVRSISQRRIRVRPHPRFPVQVPAGCFVDRAVKLPGTVDSFDLDKTLGQAWAVINYNSGPAVTAAMAGIPVFCDRSSLAAPVGNLDLSLLENPDRPDREQWLERLAYTEWTTGEIATGAPLERLLQLR